MSDCVCQAESSDGEQRLHKHLFANYNNQVRPRHDPNETVVIDLELNLHHLIKLVRLWGGEGTK